MSTHIPRTSQRLPAEASRQAFGGDGSYEERVAEHTRGYYSDGTLRYEQQRVGVRRHEYAPVAQAPGLRLGTGSAGVTAGRNSSVTHRPLRQRLMDAVWMVLSWLIVSCAVALGAGIAHAAGGFWLTGGAVALVVLFVASILA